MQKEEYCSEMIIDDVIPISEKKKKIKSGQKGKRYERQIVDILNTRFKDLLSKNPSYGMFSRSLGSGNRWGQAVVLSAAAIQTFSGDISCPGSFKFVIESKGGYNDVDLCCAFDGGAKQIDDFLEQVLDDSSRSGRMPMLIWRKDRKPRLCFLKSGLISANFDYSMKYRDWTVYNLEDVLKLPDDFFFIVSLN